MRSHFNVNLNEFVAPGQYGDRFTVPTEWRQEYAIFMRDKGINELMVNLAHGFVGADLDFLKTLPHLVAFTVLSYAIEDVTPIESLHELKYLNIDLTGENGLNFKSFRRLEQLHLQWRRGCASLFDCVSLKDLYVTHYPGKTLSSFALLKKLQSLQVSNGPTNNLEGIQGLSEIGMLGLYLLRTLTSLHGIEKMISLEQLHIDTCKRINNLDDVANLTNLKELYFNNCGDIPTIGPIRGLKKLEKVLFWESTNVLDGDLSPLAELPNLKSVAFRNRKHYTHTRGQLDSSWGEP